jgi:hypothetical protein
MSIAQLSLVLRSLKSRYILQPFSPAPHHLSLPPSLHPSINWKIQIRPSSHTRRSIATMASEFVKKLLSEGNGTDRPKVGDQVTIEYTGWLYDPKESAKDFKGKQ